MPSIFPAGHLKKLESVQQWHVECDMASAVYPAASVQQLRAAASWLDAALATVGGQSTAIAQLCGLGSLQDPATSAWFHLIA